MPPKEYYSPESASKKEKRMESFEKWYGDQIRTYYMLDFQKELFKCCMSDIQILAQACLRFRELSTIECNVDLFLEATMIASACNLAFRQD